MNFPRNIKSVKMEYFFLSTKYSIADFINAPYEYITANCIDEMLMYIYAKLEFAKNIS